MIFLLIIAAGVLLAALRWLTSYRDPYHKAIEEAGFVEKTARREDLILHYFVGPDNGPPLLLLHAQQMDWYSYSRVLPELSKSFRVYALDYHGHGYSAAPAESMNATKIGEDLAEFIETIIREPAYIAGNSVGGILAAWLAANRPELVKAIALEDPALLSFEHPGIKNTEAYRSFELCNDFSLRGGTATQGGFIMFWLSKNEEYIKKNVGKHSLDIVNLALQVYRMVKPGGPIELPLSNEEVRLLIRGISQYDPNFGAAFFDDNWNADFNHAEAIQKITCPTLLLHADFEIREDGLLYGSISQEDADRIVALIPEAQYRRISSKSAIHQDKPEEYVRLVTDFFKERGGGYIEQSSEETELTR